MNAARLSVLSVSATGASVRGLAIGTCLMAITWVCFLPGLSAPFAFDDVSNIQANPEIRQLWPLEPLLNESRAVGYYSFALNYACGAREAWPYRGTNIVLHALAGGLLFLLAQRSLTRANWRGVVSRKWLALWLALAWLLHPLQTGSVTYVVQRLESLMGLFYLLGLYGLARGAEAKHPWRWYTVVVLACWLGLFTKEVMATFVPVAMLYDRAFLAKSWFEVLRTRGWVYALCCLGVVALVWVTTFTYGADANTTAGFHSQKMTPWMYLRTQPEVLLHYVRLTLWPLGQSIDYGWPVQHNPPLIFGLGGIVLLLFFASLLLYWRQPQLGWLALACFLILAPTSSILPIDDVAFEHRMYLPLAGLLALLAMALSRACEWSFSPRTAHLCWGIMVCGALLFWCSCTVQRNIAYAHNIALWQSAVEVNPQHPRAWNNLGSAYRTAQNWSEAQRCFEQSLLLKPEDKFALTQLPLVLAAAATDDNQARTTPRAIALAEELIRLYPDLPRPRLALIMLLDKLGFNERAEQACQQLVHDLQQPGELSRKAQKRPRWDVPTLEGSPLAETHFLWALLLKKRQAWEECLQHLAQAEALAPAEASVYFQQGVVLMELQRTDEALAKYEAAIRYECSHEAAWNNLAMLLAKQGQTTAAAHSYEQALYWKPNYPEALDNFGNLYARAKKYREAIALYERALAIDASYQPAKQHLATAKQRLLNQATSAN